jgi:UDP-N-acetylmuramoyl-tripeptide--D-alanyl-D-alanine ligase
VARLSLEAIARAAGGEVILGSRPPEGGAGRVVEGYSIDTRTIRPGDLFFALVGPRVDGHDYVKDAVARGAAAVVVAKGSPGRWPEAPALVKVKDTTRALQDAGAHVRRMRRLRVVGITGSAGKTTAKELTAAVAATRFRAHKSEGNLNNAYGLPLTLLRMPDDSEAAVLEMGMSHRGEIARLAEIADPDVGVILCVLPVHLENFGTLAKVAEAKGELFRGLRRDAVAVFNVDDPPTARLGRAFGGRTVSFGLASRRAEVTASDIETEDLDGIRFVLRHGSAQAPVRLRLPGRHNVMNALAAAAAGFALDLDAEAIARGLEAVGPAPMRGVVHRLPNGVVLFDDSYNSNPAAIEKAIDLLREARPRGRRILVTGDMLELGPTGPRAHARLGRTAAAAGLDLLIAVGPLSARTAEAARTAGLAEAMHFPDAASAAPVVAAACRPGDLVLVKGSRGMRMETVVQAVLAAAGAAPGPEGGH